MKYKYIIYFDQAASGHTVRQSYISISADSHHVGENSMTLHKEIPNGHEVVAQFRSFVGWRRVPAEE